MRPFTLSALRTSHKRGEDALLIPANERGVVVVNQPAVGVASGWAERAVGGAQALAPSRIWMRGDESIPPPRVGSNRLPAVGAAWGVGVRLDFHQVSSTIVLKTTAR